MAPLFKYTGLDGSPREGIQKLVISHSGRLTIPWKSGKADYFLPTRRLLDASGSMSSGPPIKQQLVQPSCSRSDLLLVNGNFDHTSAGRIFPLFFLCVNLVLRNRLIALHKMTAIIPRSTLRTNPLALSWLKSTSTTLLIKRHVNSRIEELVQVHWLRYLGRCMLSHIPFIMVSGHGYNQRQWECSS